MSDWLSPNPTDITDPLAFIKRKNKTIEMNRKNLFLIAGILTLLVFVGYLSEPGPHKLFGFSINIWIVRLAWLLIAISNFANYIKIRNTEK